MVIACDLHDYFELVCMRASKVTLKLRDGRTLSGRAHTITQQAGEEYLVLRTVQGEQHLALTAVKQLTAAGNAQPQHNFTVDC